MQEMRIYLLNNTKPYRDGDEEYSGEWFNCPVDFEEVREKLGVEHEEQIEIADYELPFDLHSDMPLWEIILSIHKAAFLFCGRKKIWHRTYSLRCC